MNDERIKIIEDLTNLKKVILRDRSDQSFTKHSPSFIFTTENVSGYLSQIDVENKDLLVPCASGDHAFEALNKGAHKVDLFDINAYSYHIMQLKIAAIKVLSREEFLNFFLRKNLDYTENQNAFNKKIYIDKIRDQLPTYSKNFWNQVYSLFKDGKNIYNYGLIINTNNNSKAYINLLDYLKDDNYELLREKFHKLDENNSTFFNYNVVHLPIYLKEKYDLILLSNIQHYMEYTYGINFSEALKKYRVFVDNNLSKALKDDGKIVSEYYYYNAFSSPKSGENQTLLEFPNLYSVMDNKDTHYKDAVMIYQKKLQK